MSCPNTVTGEHVWRMPPCWRLEKDGWRREAKRVLRAPCGACGQRVSERERAMTLARAERHWEAMQFNMTGRWP